MSFIKGTYLPVAECWGNLIYFQKRVVVWEVYQGTGVAGTQLAPAWDPGVWKEII